MNDLIKQTARANFAIWNDALKTGDTKTVAALYAETSTFLPTVNGEFKRGQLQAEEYFKHFLEKNPTGEIVEDEVQILSPTCYLHSGMYNFELGPDNKREIVEARFTFVWEKDAQGKWRIIHHHSSGRPGRAL